MLRANRRGGDHRLSLWVDRNLRYLLVTPTVLLLCLVSLAPILYLLYLSVHEITMVSFRTGGTFTGLSNYVRVLTRDPFFWPSLFRTVQYVGVTITIQFCLGMGLALLMNNDFPGRNIVNNVLLIPVMTTPIVVATLWKYLLNLNNGGINLFLSRFLGVNSIPWLTNRPIPVFEMLLGTELTQTLNLNYAFVSIVLVNVWQWTPFVFLLLYAGIRSLPQEMYEAARVDGASAFQTFFAITLPMLKPVITVAFLLRLVDLMKVFDQIWALFGNAAFVRTLNIHLYTVGLMNQDYGMGATLSVLVLLLSLGMSMLFLRVVRSERSVG